MNKLTISTALHSLQYLLIFLTLVTKAIMILLLVKAKLYIKMNKYL